MKFHLVSPMSELIGAREKIENDEHRRHRASNASATGECNQHETGHPGSRSPVIFGGRQQHYKSDSNNNNHEKEMTFSRKMKGYSLTFNNTRYDDKRVPKAKIIFRSYLSCVWVLWCDCIAAVLFCAVRVVDVILPKGQKGQTRWPACLSSASVYVCVPSEQ